MTRTARIGGIVLAAGASCRAGCAKALATIDGETLVARAARILREGGCDDVVVVVGPPHAGQIQEAVQDVWIAHNDQPERGMLSSLKAGLALAEPAEWDAAVVALVDQPQVHVSTVRALVESFWRSDAELIQPSYDGKRGHPYLVTRSAFPLLLQGSDGVGARPVLNDLSPALLVRVEDAHVLDDVDTAQDLERAGAQVPGTERRRTPSGEIALR